ncbi:MAG TPA: GNAT family N-acetyltransferase [Rectinemataceae bacterium]|nr:GNAT family N-acetyltransferase [Rectinemataceae bacterium]
MHPFIRDKDVATITPLQGGIPRIGAVVAVALPDSGRLVVHRLVAAKEGGWLVQGDNCPGPDGIVSTTCVLGKVVKVERRGRRTFAALGGTGALVAALSRSEALVRIRWAISSPRYVAGKLLRFAQTAPLYRRLGRKLVGDIMVEIADEAALEEVQSRLNPWQPHRVALPNPDVVDWVARKGGALVGFVQFVHRGEEQGLRQGDWLRSIYVWPASRGLGIGDRLVETVREKARAIGAKELSLIVRRDNKAAIGLYEKHGFRVAEDPSRTDGANADNMHMVCSLRRDG